MEKKTKEVAGKITSTKLDVERLAKGGLDTWPIMEDGKPETGIDYEYDIAKIVSFTSQPTKKNPEKFFNYVTVIAEDGTTLCLPINAGLISTYYQEHLNEDNEILDDHSCDFSVSYNVMTFLDKNGKIEKDGNYEKKKVSKIVYQS